MTRSSRAATAAAIAAAEAALVTPQPSPVS